MKRKNSLFTVARIVLIALTLVIVVFSCASCDGLLQGLMNIAGGMATNPSCEHNNMMFFPYTPAKCDKDGNYECYACRDCGGYFRDAEGKNRVINYLSLIIPELDGEHNYADGACTKCGQCQHLSEVDCFCSDCNETLHDMEFFGTVEYTCFEDGVEHHYECLKCGRFYNDQYGEDEITDKSTLARPTQGHYYDPDGICIRCGDVTCLHTSVTGDCVCLLCYETVHADLNFVPETQPTCTQPGYVDYYKCPICGKVFPESEPTNEVTDINDIIIHALGGEHNYVDGICSKCNHCYGSPDDEPAYPFEGNPLMCRHLDMICFPYQAPTCTGGGSVEHYYCNDCYKYFFDAKGENKIENDITDTFIPNLGHKTVGYVCERCGNLHFTLESSGEQDGDFHSAIIQLLTLYNDDYRGVTPSDYELISKIVVEDKEFTVSWSIANESITLNYDEDGEVYIVDIPDVVSENCYYSLVATLSNGEGTFDHFIFIRMLEATSNEK